MRISRSPLPFRFPAKEKGLEDTVLTALHRNVTIKLQISAGAGRMVPAALLPFVVELLICITIQDSFHCRQLKAMKEKSYAAD